MKHFLEQILKGPYNFLTDKYFREFLRLTLFYGGVKRYYPKKIKLLSHRLDVPDCLSFIWQFKEIFVDGQYKFITNNSNPVILDCGANVGLSILYFKMFFPNSKIKAYEPNKYILEYLKKNISLNKLHGVEINDKAIWIHDEGVNFSEDKADSASITNSKSTDLVDSIRLKSILESESHVDFLKIDIEGAEIEVIKDCRSSLNNVKNIFIEYHSFTQKNQQLDAILKVLTENNFRYYIKPAVSKKVPFINKQNKNNPNMDAQFNIFAYKQ